MLEFIVHYSRRTHLQLCLLSLRTVNYHKDIVETDSAFICHSHLTSHWEAIVVGDCEFTCNVELKTLEKHRALLG